MHPPAPSQVIRHGSCHSIWWLLLCLVFAAVVPSVGRLHAQATGRIDAGFSTSDGLDSGFYGQVTSIKPQNNGKIFITGYFTRFGNSPRNHLALLNSDGSLDPTFDPGLAALNDTAFYTSIVAIQGDGKPLVSYYGTAYGLVRLNLDGSKDASFSRSVSNRVLTAATLSNGQILIGGAFASFNGITPDYLARINADGSPDAAFDSVGVGPNGYVNSLTVQSDGKILIGGTFTTYNGVSRNRIARLNSDGSLDTSFDPGTGADNSISAVVLQPDGKVIIAGGFANVAGTARAKIARLNGNGSLDAGYIGSNLSLNPIAKAVLQPDGKLLCVCNYDDRMGLPTFGSSGEAIRLDTSGSRDTTFNPDSSTLYNQGVKPSINGIAVQSDGKILLGGSFSILNGAARSDLVRLNTDLTPDTSFYANGSSIDAAVLATAAPGDGKIYIGGTFATVRGGVRNGIARLGSDGSNDATFDPGTGVNDAVRTLAVQPDAKLLLGGSFTIVNGVNRGRIARLNSDGSLEATFGAGAGANAVINALLVQTDGKILVGGDFTTYNGVARNRVARLNTDGSLDSAFDPGAGADAAVQKLALQSDGKLLVGGSFTVFGGARHPRLARLNTDGTLDANFTGTAYPGNVTGLVAQTDGKVAIAGTFTSVNGVDGVGIARLNANGTTDTTFVVQRQASDDAYNALLPQSDARLLVGGYFGAGTYRSLERLNINGTIDGTFSQNPLLSSPVYTLTQQVEGKVIVTYNGGVAQFFADDGTVQPPTARTGTAVTNSSGNAATLYATVNNARNYYFQYGTTTSYGNYSGSTSSNAGNVDTGVSANVANLTPGVTYHYRITASNGTGSVVGADATFVALPPAQSWRQTYFGTTSNTGNAADTADPDGDGITNLLERALGLNPTVASVSGLPTGAIDTMTGRLVLTANRGANTADLTFSAEASADLVNWTTNGVTILMNTSTTFQARDDGPAGACRFLRLRVVQP